MNDIVGSTINKPDEHITQSGPAHSQPGRFRRSMAVLGDCIIPPVCVACQARVDQHDTLCPQCWSGIVFIRAPLCDRLGIPLPFDTGGPSISAAAYADPPDFDRARVVAYHAGTMRRLVHGLKYNDRNEGRRLFGTWMAAAGHELIASADFIVPVPLARWRLLWRRFNQSAELARETARRAELPFAPTLLHRHRATRPQVGMTPTQRRENVAGAFRVPHRHKHRLAGKSVLLIDDVITTGATVNACARALKKAGAARVDVLALSRASGDILTPQ